MWRVQNAVIWLMCFDLFEHFFKMCVGGIWLGAHYPAVTQRIIILAVGRAKHTGLSALHSYLCSEYILTRMGHIMLWFASLLAPLELLQRSIRDVARQKRCGQR